MRTRSTYDGFLAYHPGRSVPQRCKICRCSVYPGQLAAYQVNLTKAATFYFHQVCLPPATQRLTDHPAPPRRGRRPLSTRFPDLWNLDA